MKKISTKLWFLMLLLILITLILMWVFQIQFLDEFYMKGHIKNIQKEGNAIISMLLDGASDAEIIEKADELYIRYNVGIDLLSPQGEVLYSAANTPMMLAKDKSLALTSVQEGKSYINTVRHGKFNIQHLIIGLPILEKDTIKGIIIMNAPLAPVEEAAGILKQQLMIITAILIFISLFLTYFFSKLFTKPILKINEAAKKMAEGNWSVKVEFQSRDELGMLSDTINHLSIQLQKIEQLRKELIANVSHEFRTPLSLIKGYAETMRDVTGNNPIKREKQLGIIIEEADRLKVMVDDILNLSQIQSQYFEVKKETFDMTDTVHSVANRFAYLQESTGIRLHIPSDKSPILVNADEGPIEQVLYNLINNAYNHTENGGSIKVNLSCCENRIRVEITDNGTGIPQEELPFIWDRFYKVSQGKKRQQGTGVGLAIVKSILEAHKSQFGVESEVGKGTTFWFELEQAEGKTAQF